MDDRSQQKRIEDYVQDTISWEASRAHWAGQSTPRSLQYLEALLMELHRARAFPLVNIVKDPDEYAHTRRVAFVEAEIDQLLQQPELFPSDAVRTKFLALVALDANLQFFGATKGLLLQSELQAIDEISKTRSRGPYPEDTVGWENFLLNMAPGGPEDPTHRAETTPISSLQMLSAVGLRIVRDLEREEREIVRYVDQSPTQYGISPAQTTLMVDFDKPASGEDVAPHLHLPSRSCCHFVRPNPYIEANRIRLDISHQTADPIPSMGSFIHRLDYPPPDPFNPITTLTSPDVFPVLSLRSWHPPDRFWDLQYVGEDGEVEHGPF